MRESKTTTTTAVTDKDGNVSGPGTGDPGIVSAVGTGFIASLTATVSAFIGKRRKKGEDDKD